MKLQMPIRIYSEANNGYKWKEKSARKKAQQTEFMVHWRNAKLKPELPCKVVFTRHASRFLDDDNLAIGFKGVRDQLAREIGLVNIADNLRSVLNPIAAKI